MDSGRGGLSTAAAAGSRGRPQSSDPNNRATAVVTGSAMDTIRPPAFGRGIVVSVLASAAVFALAIMASGGTPRATGVPMTETTTPLFWGLCVVVVVLVGLGAQYAEATADKAALALGQPRRRKRLPTAWAVPSAAVGSALLLVATYHNAVMLAVGPAVAFFGVAGALLARDLLDDVTDATQRTAATIHTVVIHLVAFIGLSAVYMNKMSGLIGAPLVGLIAGVLILESMQRTAKRDEEGIVYGILGGLLMAMLIIAVNWWPTRAWTGGAVLIVCFFTITGVTTSVTGNDRPNPRDLAAYLIFALTGLIILSFTI